MHNLGLYVYKYANTYMFSIKSFTPFNNGIRKFFEIISEQHSPELYTEKKDLIDSIKREH